RPSPFLPRDPAHGLVDSCRWSSPTSPDSSGRAPREAQDVHLVGRSRSYLLLPRRIDHRKDETSLLKASIFHFHTKKQDVDARYWRRSRKETSALLTEH